MLGTAESYFIHDGYHPRLDNAEYDDRNCTDQFQKDVYIFARKLVHPGAVVHDIGCGSGYKLAVYFRDCDTTGFDLPFLMPFLRQRWPRNKWEPIDLSAEPPRADLVICADVIEHIREPNTLMRYMRRSGAPRLVLSTPERSLLKCGTDDGPPRNPCHVREWDRFEFAAYVKQWFHIRSHIVSVQTQIVECEP